jgi:predicted acylesterase/phospholipase RssA
MAGADPGDTTLAPCDLVMKGGITSGVVYPTAIQRLSQRYVFRNVGGASAGAIAAVVAAACEFRRRAGHADSFDRLKDVNDELTRPHFIEGLFQPTPHARPAFDAALAFQAGQRAGALRLLLKRSPASVGIVVAAAVLWIAFVALSVVSLASGGVSTIEIVALVALGLVALPALAVLLATAAALALASIVGELNNALMGNGFGICSGATEKGHDQKGLTDWLHEQIQHCAGLPLEDPLTFEKLKGDDSETAIALQLVTTDLSYSRPVDLPLPDDPDEAGQTAYCFDRRELARLFPDEVIEAMTRVAEQVRFVEGGDVYYRMPGSKLPIVVAARLSLSFPILLSTVPLWSKDEGERWPVRHTMSDGGISSNFPIHFFDVLLPRWPTFGLDLEPYPDPADDATAPRVVFGPQRRAPVFTSVSNVLSFARQILNAALDWRDTMQAELPGFRDRVCQIRLTKEEGGLNLNMPSHVVEALQARGRLAGDTIVRDFRWDCHRFMRYLTFMQVMQEGLKPAGLAFSEFVGQVPTIPPDCPKGYEFGKPPPWDQDEPLTSTFLAGITWGDDGTPDFAAHPPTPKGWARVTPRV